MAYLNQQLKTAIEKQDEDTMEQLLECGADPNAFLSGEDIAPIHLGPGMSKSITSLLLKYGGDPNLRTSDGITPLHIAATWGNKSIIKLLLYNGANVYIRDDEGFTPLDMAKRYEHEKCEIILKQHLHTLESQTNNQQRKVRQKPPNTKTETYSKRVIDNNRNVDANQNLSVDQEYRPSRAKRENPRRSVLYRKEIQNQIDRLCENKEDFHLDITSPDHPCVNVTPKMQCHRSSPKHIRAYSEPMTENTSTPIRPRRSLYTTSVQHKIDGLTDNGENIGIDVTSPDHPELFLTPNAKSPLNYHKKIYGETPINSHKANVMVSKSSDSSSSESDLYVTVNEESGDYRNKEIQNILNVDEMKHSMTHKIEQLRNCLNKLDTQKPFITNDDKLYCRSKEPYHRDLSSEKHKNRKVLGQNPDVDVKFTMELPPKMVLDERKPKKIEHSKPYTIEMNLGQKYKKSEGKNAKKEPIIDIQIQPKGESPHMKYKVRNQNEAGVQINPKPKSQERSKESYKRKVNLKSPEIQEKHNSRIRSKSAHENTCFQAEQDRKSPGKNMNGRYRQETYPGERISTVHLTRKNQRGNERYDYNDAIDPSVLVTHGSRNHSEKSNGHSENAYIIKSLTENVPLSSYRHVTSRNYKSKLPLQNQELPHYSNMANEKMTAQSHVQHNERASNFSREREIIPEKSSYTACRKDHLIFPSREKNPRRMKPKDLSKPQQKTVFLKERSESQYLNCNQIPENQLFRQKGCMVINQKPKVDAVQKIVSQKVAHASLDKRATKFPDCAVHSESRPPNTDSRKTQLNDKSRQSTSSATSTDTYYTCPSELDAEDFFSCENGQESCSEDYLPFLTDASKRPVPSFFEELTEVLGSKDSSYLREFEFSEDELIHALSEFNLREPNSSTLTETLFNALSSIRKPHDKEVESSDGLLVATNQLRNTQVAKPKRDGNLRRTGSPLRPVSPIDIENLHIRRRTRITARSSPPHESLNATDGQYEEFETAIEEVLLSRSPSKYKSQFSNQIVSESDSVLQASSGPNRSRAVSPTSLKSESNTSDTFFLVCVPPTDNQLLCNAPQHSANINSRVTRDEVDHQYGGNLHPERDENSSLNPVERDLFHSCIDNENMPGKIKDDSSPYASDFSKVLSELKQKTDLKALQSQKKPCYRWQPPENVMNSSHTDDSFLNGNERDQKLKVLKKRVGLELKNHPLVKSQKSAIEKSFDSHDDSVQDEDFQTAQNDQSRLRSNSEEDEFNETQLKRILTGKYLDSSRQPQMKRPNSLRRNVLNQKAFSKSDTAQIPHYKSVQNEHMIICKELDTRKIAEKNQSYFPGFDTSYNPSPSKDHSCYHSLEKGSENSRETVSSDDSVELEQSCYTSLRRERSLNAEHSCYSSFRNEESLNAKQSRSVNKESSNVENSCYTSVSGENSSDIEQSCYVSTCRDESKNRDCLCCASDHKEDIPEAEKSCYVSVHRGESTDDERPCYNSAYRKGYKSGYALIQKEDSIDMGQSRYVSYCRDRSLDTDRSCYTSFHTKGFSEVDQSCYTSVRRDGSPEVDQSCYTSVRRDGSSEVDQSCYISVRRDRSPEVDQSCYTSVRREVSPHMDQSHYFSIPQENYPDADRSYTSTGSDDSPDADKSHYVSARREDFPDADKSHYVSARREDFPDADKSHYVSVRREDFPDADKSHYVSAHREDFPDADKSHYVSARREDFPDADKSHYVSARREDFPDADKSHYVSVRKEDFPDADKSHYVSAHREDFPDADKSHYVSARREDFPDADKSHYVSARREDFPDADKSHYVSARREDFPDADKSHYVSARREDFPDAYKSHYVSARREDFPDADKSHYVSARREDFPDAYKSHYVSARREDFPDADKSHYVSARREDFPDADKSHYVSARREDFPDADKSHYVSVRREDFPDADKSHYVSVREEHFPDADKSHYMSVREEHLPDADKSHYVSVREEHLPDTDKSHYVSVCREGSPEINPSYATFIYKESPPVNFKRLSTKSSRIPMLINGQLQKQQKINDFLSNAEHVTLQKRYISPPPSSCQNNKSLYVSAEDKDSFFTQDEQSKSNVESAGDNVTSSSHWQYLSAKGSAHNRSVTWQNPISTFDKIDAALVDSTDESISWSPKEKGHSPQAIPLTSTSASEEITSESMSSDEFKRCLERKKLLTPEERTTLWVNGIYKSNLQEYFDADMSSILPVLNSNASSSDTGKDIKCGATAANMTNHRYIEPSAPPQSEIIGDNFRCIPTAPPDISNIAVAGISGDKVNELSSSDYVSLHPSLYPCLVEPCQNFASKKRSEPKLKGNNDGDDSELHAVSTSAAYVSFDSEPEPTANVHCSPERIQNTQSLTGKVTKMSSVNPVPFQDAYNKAFLMRSNIVNKLHQTAKSISTQTPVLRIPPDPPNKSESLPAAFGMTTQSRKLNKEKLPQKGWAKLKKIFTAKKIQGKIGNKAFISVNSRQSFLPNLSELSPPSTDTSGTQTDPDIFYEPTLKHLEIVKSDEVSLSVNFSENLSDYSEKYPSSVLPNIAEYFEQATRTDFLEICSSSGATSGSMERLLSPYREDSNEDDDVDEVDHVESNTYPMNYCGNEEFGKDESQPISAETKVYGETYKTKLSQADKRRKSNNIEFLHTDPEMHVQFIERQISAENQNGDQLNDSESTEIYEWKSFSKSFDDDRDNLPQTENKSLYWRTCGDKPDDVKTNVKKSKKPLTDLGCLSDAQFRQTLIDHGLSNPGPVTKDTRQLYLKRLKNQSGQQTLACTQSPPDYNAELCRAFNERINWIEMVDLEEKMIKKFDNSKNTQKWREGNEKSSFNYLLLDPRVTRNLPCRSSKMDDTLETFRTFVKAIFYIGKGKRSRPYAHLYEAIKYSQGNSIKVNEKISHINDIWKNGYGVVSLHCFQNVIPVEAYSREACMVDAIGCCNLTNKKRGDFYGLTSTWCLKLKRRMGVYFLHKALRIFMAEGERQIYLTDLH